MIVAIIYDNANGVVKVPNKSKNTANCIEKQNRPGNSGVTINSNILCIVPLIHLRLCDSNTLNSLGTIVSHTADGQYIVLRFGNARKMSVVRYRSSPNNNKFF